MLPRAGFPADQPGTPVVQYDVVLDFPRAPEVRLPALMLRLTEYRSGGWSGSVKINPRKISAAAALQALLQDGLRPGNAVLVKLLTAGRAVRIWPSVVTSVNTTSSRDVDEPDAVCSVTIRDPLTYLGDRPIWTAFVDCPLGKVLGGAMSSAAGGAGRPTNNPILTGLPVVSIREELRSEVAEMRYAIAAGDRMGRWLTRLWARLGVRISMIGTTDGTLRLTLCDAVPSNTDLNADGGLDMTLDPSREASATNLTFSGLDVNPPAPVRGGLRDAVGGGEPSRFGPDGALESVLIEPQTNADEAARRAGFRLANRRLSQTRLTVASCQSGLLPGRVVNLKPLDPLSRSRTLGDEPTFAGVTPGRGVALLGASRWQAVDVAHLCLKARYWNEALFEKTGLAWRPDRPDEHGAAVVSGVVDDGVSKTGELVSRDRLGRVPIRLSFVPEPDVATDTESSPPGDVPWPPRVPLAPLVPGAGTWHGFIPDHRQGDWCRIAVINPLWAEIIGYSHRDDRHLGENTRDATLGVVMCEDAVDWCGMVFRADAAESSDDV